MQPAQVLPSPSERIQVHSSGQRRACAATRRASGAYALATAGSGGERGLPLRAWISEGVYKAGIQVAAMKAAKPPFADRSPSLSLRHVIEPGLAAQEQFWLPESTLGAPAGLHTPAIVLHIQ
jgi:hypothetical protein